MVESLKRTREDPGIWVERLGCSETAWEVSGLPNLQLEGQVDSDGKYCSAITNTHCAIEI